MPWTKWSVPQKTTSEEIKLISKTIVTLLLRMILIVEMPRVPYLALRPPGKVAPSPLRYRFSTHFREIKNDLTMNGSDTQVSFWRSYSERVTTKKPEKQNWACLEYYLWSLDFSPNRPKRCNFENAFSNPLMHLMWI